MKRRFSWPDVLMWFTAATFLAPLVVMVMTSFKPEAEVLNPAAIIMKAALKKTLYPTGNYCTLV